ncbi:MAG: S-methyl-5'-thioadenosine phosphorylase [Myxococcales bacterium]|nr:S-methyl-5'-thioadenosine phosphorylase [Myxococcales bacterium]MCB9646321.1 S-methyl-5'-thioadenosine phosphorylase [Deltaproteobacteria bacterium]
MGEPTAIGVIGGSGLYGLDGLESVREIRVQTPFGDPSDALVEGWLNGHRLVFLPRHGKQHTLTPSEIPFQANIWALKSVGVDRLISISAVGSMKEHIVPGHFVLVDQFIDRTRGRPTTLFGRGVVVHVPFAEPVCPALRKKLLKAAEAVDVTVHDGGTYLCMEGPQFSTRAESLLHRSWGVDVIGMTNLPEAKLAREAEMSYATVAMATDYDCWHEEEESVEVGAILQVLRTNAEKAKALLVALTALPPGDDTSPMCLTAARTSLLTPPDAIPEGLRRDLDPIFRHFLPPLKGDA